MPTWIVTLRRSGKLAGHVLGETYGEAMNAACVLAGSHQALCLAPIGSWPTLLKCCPCCQAEYDAASWSKLVYVGQQTDAMESLILRNCACGTTLAIHPEALHEELEP